MKTQRFFILTAVICIASLFSVDLAYAYHPVSPYAYCLNNPVKYVDPDGQDVWEFDNRGNIVNHDATVKTHDAFYMVKSQEARVIKDGIGYDIYTVKGDDHGTSLFTFMANPYDPKSVRSQFNNY